MALFHAVSNTNDVEIKTPCKIMVNKVPRRNKAAIRGYRTAFSIDSQP